MQNAKKNVEMQDCSPYKYLSIYEIITEITTDNFAVRHIYEKRFFIRSLQ